MMKTKNAGTENTQSNQIQNYHSHSYKSQNSHKTIDKLNFHSSSPQWSNTPRQTVQ